MCVLRELLRLLPAAELMRWLMGSAPPAVLQALLYGPATEQGRRTSVLSSADHTLEGALTTLGVRTAVLKQKLGHKASGGSGGGGGVGGSIE